MLRADVFRENNNQAYFELDRSLDCGDRGESLLFVHSRSQRISKCVCVIHCVFHELRISAYDSVFGGTGLAGVSSRTASFQEKNTQDPVCWCHLGYVAYAYVGDQKFIGYGADRAPVRMDIADFYCFGGDV